MKSRIFFICLVLGLLMVLPLFSSASAQVSTPTTTRTATPWPTIFTPTPTRTINPTFPDLSVLSITEYSYTAPTATPNAQGCWPSGPTNAIGLRVRIQNSGLTAAGSFVLYLESWEGHQRTVNSLAAGQMLDVDFTGVTLNRELSLSRFARVDYLNQIDETDESNNNFVVALTEATPTRTGTAPVQTCFTRTPTGGPSATRTRTLTRTPTPSNTPTTPPGGNQPDLVITTPPYWIWDPNAYDSVNQCYNYTPLLVWNVQVKNAGSAAAGSFVVNQNYDRQQVVSGLPAGQTSTLLFPFPGRPVATAMPGQPTLSTMYSNFLVDYTNVVSESNETNNTTRGPIPAFTATLTGGPTKVFCKTPTPGTPVPTLTPTATASLTRTPTPNGPLSAEFVGSPLTGSAPLAVTFTATGNTSGTQSCTLFFGDGTGIVVDGGCFQTFNHTYTTPGSYTVTFHVAGATDVVKQNYVVVSSGPTLTPTPTQPTSGICTPVTSTITVPFTFDGAGTFCWQASSLGGFINSWNTTSVSVNGMNATNLYVASGSYPAKINGFYYVNYNSTVAWAHFEARP